MVDYSDDHYDPDIRYLATLQLPEKREEVEFKTLKDLIDDLFIDDTDISFFNQLTEKGQDECRGAIRKQFEYTNANITIYQVDISEDKELICNCPSGFKGNGPGCPKCKD